MGWRNQAEIEGNNKELVIKKEKMLKSAAKSRENGNKMSSYHRSSN